MQTRRVFQDGEVGPQGRTLVECEMFSGFGCYRGEFSRSDGSGEKGRWLQLEYVA